VLVNLLSNAGRHTPGGTTVTVRLSVGRAASGGDEAPDAGPEAAPQAAAAGIAAVRRGVVPTGPRMTLTVTDDGPGIPPGLLPELFERFTRADTARSHAGDPSSTGLGLAIVDAVVAAHGGAVLVSSRPGMTRFTIILPRPPEPREDGQRRARAARRARA